MKAGDAEVISFALAPEEFERLSRISARIDVQAGVDTAQPRAFTIRNNSFEAEQPGAFVTRNHNFRVDRPGAYTIRNYRFERA